MCVTFEGTHFEIGVKTTFLKKIYPRAYYYNNYVNAHERFHTWIYYEVR